jgi:hypothetical protein
MYVPFQEVFTAGLIGVGMMKDKKDQVISDGKVLDYCGWHSIIEEVRQADPSTFTGPKKCVDDDLNQRCTRRVLVHKSTCYTVRHAPDRGAPLY